MQQMPLELGDAPDAPCHAPQSARPTPPANPSESPDPQEKTPLARASIADAASKNAANAFPPRRTDADAPASPGDNARAGAETGAAALPGGFADAAAQPDAGAGQPCFTHPRANQHILLGAVHVRYELRRSQRRSIGLSIGADGLRVTAPHLAPLAAIHAALHAKSRWIVEKLHQSRQRQQQAADSRIDWRDGASLPYLGAAITLRIDPHQRHTPAGAALLGDKLHIGLPPGAGARQLREATHDWLMRQARRLFTQRLDHFAPQLGVQWRRLTLSSAKTRWGSASANGCIRLNWRLIHHSPPVIDYVVVHELAHLREMNHSPRFWQHVHAVLPNYQALRRELLRQPVPAW